MELKMGLFDRILSDCALLCADDDDTMAVLVGKDITSKACWACAVQAKGVDECARISTTTWIKRD